MTGQRGAATAILVATLFPALLAGEEPLHAWLLDHVPKSGGICVLLDPQPAEAAIALAGRQDLVIYCQLPSDSQVAAARKRVDQAGLLGTRIYVEKGSWSHIHLADNLADVVVVSRDALVASPVCREELLRVINPLGRVWLGEEQFTRPFPTGIDDWSHPYPITGPTTIPKA